MSRVALIGKNSVGFIEGLIGIWNCGACAVIIDWRIPIITAVEMMKEAGVKKCLLGKTQYERINERLPDEIEFVIFDDECKKATQLPCDIVWFMSRRQARFPDIYPENKSLLSNNGSIICLAKSSSTAALILFFIMSYLILHF